MPRDTAVLPTSLIANSWTLVKNPAHFDVWYNGVPPMVQHKRLADYALNATTQKEFYTDPGIFHCPSAKLPAPSALYPFFSMSMNSKLISSAATSGVKAGSVQRPSDTVAFLENCLSTEAMLPPQPPALTDLGQASSYASRFVLRHEKRGTLVFLDGHARNFSAPEVMVMSGANYHKAYFPQAGIVWTPDPTADANQ